MLGKYQGPSSPRTARRVLVRVPTPYFLETTTIVDCRRESSFPFHRSRFANCPCPSRRGQCNNALSNIQRVTPRPRRVVSSFVADATRRAAGTAFRKQLNFLPRSTGPMRPEKGEHCATTTAWDGWSILHGRFDQLRHLRR